MAAHLVSSATVHEGDLSRPTGGWIYGIMDSACSGFLERSGPGYDSPYGSHTGIGLGMRVSQEMGRGRRVPHGLLAFRKGHSTGCARAILRGTLGSPF